ncbi:MAG: PQQ-binding-like beta-propeller repeat protein [Planctomycetaceae bacterium]
MLSFVLIATSLLLADPPAWPGFLGAGATPIDAASIPLKWSPTENVAWDASLPGHGQSSPVIWGEKVFVTTVEGDNKETCHTLCLSLKDGAILWDHKHASTAPDPNSVYISRAAPTPVVDASHVFAFFECGDLVALTHDGKEVWTKSLSKEYSKFVNKFGLSGSPVQTETSVIVLVDDEGPSYLVAFNKADGKILWKTDRTARSSWSSPALLTIEGQPQVVVSSAGTIDGYDPVSGKMLWTFDKINGNTATTPLQAGPNQFLVAASPGRTGENAEGAKTSNALVKVTKDGDAWKVEKVWMSSEATPSWASPFVHEGLAYWVNRQGVVYCIDAATGEQKYAKRTKQSCWATPIPVGDRIYFFGKEGATTVLAAGPEFKELAVNELWPADTPPSDNGAPKVDETSADRKQANAMFSGPTQYGVAAVSGSLLIRVGSHVFCIRD